MPTPYYDDDGGDDDETEEDFSEENFDDGLSSHFTSYQDKLEPLLNVFFINKSIDSSENEMIDIQTLEEIEVQKQDVQDDFDDAQDEGCNWMNFRNVKN